MRVPSGAVVPPFSQIDGSTDSTPIEPSGDPIEGGGHDGGSAPLPGPDSFVCRNERRAEAMRLIGQPVHPLTSEQ